MGLFNKMFETKYCSICGTAIAVFGNRKLKDGNCCKDCESMFSPFFRGRKQSTVAEIKYQVDCRKNNIQRLQMFNATRTIGAGTKVLVDEEKGQFVVTASKSFKKDNADVIDCEKITDCSIDIVESYEEIEYQDSNGNTKSFNPPSYAYSYDFFVEIAVNIPYIDDIRFKINDTPVNNGQKTLIKLDGGGLLSKFSDALLPAKSNNGKTSNASEVKASAQYQKCEQTANDIRNLLLSQRSIVGERNAHKQNKIICPWCGTKVIPNDQGTCNRCGGILDN